MFIALEGLSGVGKTIVGKMLAKRLGAYFYQTPADSFKAVRKQVDKDITNSSRFLFYLAGVVESANEIEEILMKKSVVCDRYILSTICYHRAAGLNFNLPNKLIFSQLPITPDYTFLL